MKQWRQAGGFGLVLGCLAAPAWGAYGQIDSFAASATNVVAGSEVQFAVSWSIGVAATQYGGSDQEPPPADGYQYWYANWYYTDFESVTSVAVQVGDQSYAEFPPPAPGSSHTGSHVFTLLFPEAGSFEIAVSGGWTSQGEIYSSNETGTRYCYYQDPEFPGLSCDSWTWSYDDYSELYSGDGAFDGRSLTVTVTAVPEPATALLWAGGAALLAWRRSFNRPRPPRPRARR